MSNNKNNITELLFSILNLLGFDSINLEKQYKITLNSSTFNKPNSKAFEVIIHFLFVQLDLEQSNRIFRDCWPALLKEQQKEFRDSVYSWLVDLSSKSKSIKFPHVTKSLLLTPSGQKVYELLYAFSQYVLLSRLNQLIDQNKLNVYIWPKLNLQLNEKSKLLTKKQLFQSSITINALKQKINLEFIEFQKLIKTYYTIKIQAKEFSEEKITNLRQSIEMRQKMKFKLNELNENLKKRLETTTNGNEEKQYKLIENRFKNFINKWSQLKELLSLSENKISNIDYICNGNCNKYTLNGNDYKFEVPDKLMIEYGHTIKNHKIGDIYSYNNLDLLNLIKLYNLIIMIQGEAILKIDKKQFNDWLNLIERKNIVNLPIIINERSIEIKKEFDSIIPKLKDETRYLKTKLQLKSNLNIENMTKTNYSNIIEQYLNIFSSQNQEEPLNCLKLNNFLNTKSSCSITTTTKQQSNFLLLNDNNTSNKENNLYLFESSFNDVKINYNNNNNSSYSNDQSLFDTSNHQTSLQLLDLTEGDSDII